jgi:voltage-gated potassium channel
MNGTRHLLFAVIFSIVVIITGTLGYMGLEGWSFIDAIYMTFITITTVGFGEVNRLTFSGRLFTIVLIFLGFGFCAYVAGAVVQFMVEGRLRVLLGRRALNKKINRLQNHYVICGYGRIGRVLCKKLAYAPFDIVVIEKNPELIRLLDEDGVLYLEGDATDESALLKAGIQRAKGLVAALGTDTENVFLVLTARQLNKAIKIMARSSSESARVKLLAAGATDVESPYELGATRMAQRLLRPTVTSFIDLAMETQRNDIQMEEIPVSAGSPLAGIRLLDSGIRKQFNLIIIAIKKSDDRMQFNPSFDTVIEGGDTVIAVGEAENLKKLEKILTVTEPSTIAEG